VPIEIQVLDFAFFDKNGLHKSSKTSFFDPVFYTFLMVRRGSDTRFQKKSKKRQKKSIPDHVVFDTFLTVFDNFVKTRQNCCFLTPGPEDL
jgi:hypothetical protein